VTDLVIAGLRGRMGETLQRLMGEGAACARGLRLVGGIGRTAAAGNVPVQRPEEAGPLIRAAAVIVDFSGPEGTASLLRHQADALAGRALVVGSTGLADEAVERLDALASRGPVLVAANFSLGVNLLAALVERAAAALPEGEWDLEVVEAHHRRKLDAPSGTALMLAEAASRGRRRQLAEIRRDGRSGITGERPEGEIGLHAVRGGGVVGEHQVLLLGERERLQLTHQAMDRAVFAEGALRAAQWIGGRAPGRYGMVDVLGLGR
jgi:4-hydroxy-tetrahydrodipicolinate reductase